MRRRRGRPKGATSDATRARILAAARRSFAELGFAGTTNKDIADGAGITAAALYGYFDSKADLYAATARDAQAELLPAFRRAADAEATARGALRAVMAASARLHARDPSLAAFLSAMPIELKREAEIARAMDEAPSEILALFQSIVDRGVKRREISRARARHVVSMFLACSMGMSLLAATFGADDFDRTMDAFLALVDGELFSR